MPAGWNFADIFEVIAEQLPDAPAQLFGGHSTTWAEFDARADGVASVLLQEARQQDKVAQYLRNRPEYLESIYACFKAGLAPVNTNYRYTDDELLYLWGNADVVAVVFAGEFSETCDRVRGKLPAIRTWLWVDDAHGECPEWAISYEQAASAAAGRTVAPWGRSGDDLMLLYTGGTTGLPKGVMWRQDDLVCSLESSNRHRLPEHVDLDAVRRRAGAPGPRNLPGAPLMHGTGLFNGLGTMLRCGSVVTLPGATFDPIAMLDTIEREQVNAVTVVGDAFAKPILRALDAEPTRWDLSSLRMMFSSGVMWSAETKVGLLRHVPRLLMVDSLGSSEAINVGSSTTTADSPASGTASFRLGPNAKVLTEDGREVLPGSGERGLVALRGRAPIGYYKDPDKSAATFRVIDGDRWSFPGDWAEVEADGTVRLLGRGSNCINTGGEKVYPEEVEEALKTHPSIADAAVVGLPDERFGQAITAVVQPAPGATIDAAELIAHVRRTLAAFKSPKHIVAIDDVGRANNGKLNYAAILDYASARVG